MLKNIDPRYFQMAIVFSLIILGTFTERFNIQIITVAVIISTILATQWAACKIISLPFDWRSPTTTSLSLILLLRADSLIWPALAAFIAIVTKFTIRFNGKHIFNPSNIAIVSLLLFSEHVWVSPGQWGSYLWLFFLLCFLAQFVIHKSSRSYISIGFLLIYSAMLTIRAIWLGDPIEIPMHHLQSGALLIFTFFMLSDPKSTPDSKYGQLGFAFLTASLTLYFQFQLYNFNGLFYALAIASLTTPIWDKLFQSEKYQWVKSRSNKNAN